MSVPESIIDERLSSQYRALPSDTNESFALPGLSSRLEIASYGWRRPSFLGAFRLWFLYSTGDVWSRNLGTKRFLLRPFLILCPPSSSFSPHLLLLTLRSPAPSNNPKKYGTQNFYRGLFPEPETAPPPALLHSAIKSVLLTLCRKWSKFPRTGLLKVSKLLNCILLNL